MPSLHTTSHFVKQALRFINDINATNAYIGLARETAWAEENDPPELTGNETVLDGPICYKPIEPLKLCKPDPGGEIAWQGETFTEVALGNAYSEGAHYVYVYARISHDEGPLVSFRQAGMFSNLTPAVGAPAGLLLPAQVDDPGVLEFIDNHPPVYRTVDMVNVIGKILRFK